MCKRHLFCTKCLFPQIMYTDYLQHMSCCEGCGNGCWHLALVDGVLAGFIAGVLIYHCISNYRSQNCKPEPSSHQQQFQFMSRCLQRILNWERMWPIGQCRALNWKQMKPMGMCSTDLLFLIVRHLISATAWSLWSFQGGKASDAYCFFIQWTC